MKIFLDGKALQVDTDADNLLELLREISEIHMGNDSAFKELLINGEPYEEARHGAPDSIYLTNVQELVIESVGSRELALAFLDSYQPVLDTLAMAADQVSELFRVGDDKKANEEYLQFLEALELLLESMQRVTNALDLDMASISHQGVSAKDRLERLSNLTGDMLSAQEDDDWVLLADLLQYDLKPEFQAWSQLMDQMRRMANPA